MRLRAAAPSSACPLIVLATLWVYRQLLLVHPSAFRHDYGQEILQVYGQACRDAYRTSGAPGVACLWLPTLWDLVRGTLAEHMMLWKEAATRDCYRTTATTIFGAYSAFMVAGLGLNQFTEGAMRTRVLTTHPAVALSYDALIVGALIALLAVLIGGIPVALAALRHAVAHRRLDILARFAVPPLALFLFLKSVMNFFADLHSRGFAAAVLISDLLLSAQMCAVFSKSA